MQIQIHTDHHIEGHEAFTAWAAGEIKDALVHHQDQITRVEAHMSDQNGHKGGLDDKRCVLEARLAGRQPMAATHAAIRLQARMMASWPVERPWACRSAWRAPIAARRVQGRRQSG